MSTPQLPIRQRILTGAARVIRAKGIGRATTREIAHAAGVSEGSLFNHFTDKLDLLGAVLAEAVPDLEALRASAGEGPGTGELAEKLIAAIEAATDFYLAILPLEAGVLADRALLERWRDRHTREDTGPQVAHRELGAYLREQLGRLTAGVDPEVLAMVLLGTAQYAAFVEPSPAPKRYPTAAVSARAGSSSWSSPVNRPWLRRRARGSRADRGRADRRLFEAAANRHGPFTSTGAAKRIQLPLRQE